MAAKLLIARGLSVAALAVCFASSGAMAGGASTDRMAYELAMKCFVANGVARGDSNDAGQITQAKTYEVRARESFDVASKLGNKLGYSDSHIHQDFGMAQTQELPKLVTDKSYLSRTTTTCEAAGL